MAIECMSFNTILLKPLSVTKNSVIYEPPLRATWDTKAAPTLPAAAVRELTLLFVTEKGFNGTLAPVFRLPLDYTEER